MAKILVVDDDDMIRIMLRQMLEREGYEVEEAINGTEALKKYTAQPADLVITDIIMPDKEGIEIIIELKKHHPGVKIIGISGGGRTGPEGYLKMAEMFGAKKTFSKPFDRKELLISIKELMA